MNRTKVLGLAVVGAFLVVAAPLGGAQAMSLINPGAATTVQQDGKVATTEVRWHWHHHWNHGWHHGWRRHWHGRHWHRHSRW